MRRGFIPQGTSDKTKVPWIPRRDVEETLKPTQREERLSLLMVVCSKGSNKFMGDRYKHYLKKKYESIKISEEYREEV
ncbi:hypothetical protein J6590_068596 [Homalodisca vitripennis]|nr:hypothetical protein J6590_068596 [Homalodisca vitripennis]